jgi:hypothetical protein
VPSVLTFEDIVKVVDANTPEAKPRGPYRKKSALIFLRNKFQNELVWSVRCKDCGEVYVLRDVQAGEVSYPRAERIPCHETEIQFEYIPAEFECLWAP